LIKSFFYDGVSLVLNRASGKKFKRRVQTSEIGTALQTHYKKEKETDFDCVSVIEYRDL